LSDLQIRVLVESDASAVGELLIADPPEYRQHFEPFSGNVSELASRFRDAGDDRYWGVFADGGELLALVMLRGLDAGFVAPAFGIYVAERHAGSGIGTLALAFAETWCRLNELTEIMLTVHPENAAARRMYERRGFDATGEQSALGHLIYRKRLPVR
jgi:RimJ/RimL family protein N-acetyltransferase